MDFRSKQKRRIEVDEVIGWVLRLVIYASALICLCSIIVFLVTLRSEAVVAATLGALSAGGTLGIARIFYEIAGR